MKEKSFQEIVLRVARANSWLCYHTYDSRRSEPGFPDLCMVHPLHGLVFVELKTTKGTITDPQWNWLTKLYAHSLVGVWRPAMMSELCKFLRTGANFPGGVGYGKERSDY